MRNQARVHLWYPEKHGIPCPPLTSSQDGIDTFLNRPSCFGIRALPRVDREKAERWQRLWPSLTVLPWPGDVDVEHQRPES